MRTHTRIYTLICTYTRMHACTSSYRYMRTSCKIIFLQFTITADQLPPPLDDESYYCVFGDVGSSLLEGNLIPGVNVTGLTCNKDFTVEQFSNGNDGQFVVK